MPNTAEFLRQHPLCCFCGGLAAAEQEDHVPPKALFARKEWPEGYVFPACGTCNQGSRQIDQIFAMLARLSVADQNVSEAEFGKLLAGVRNNAPGAEPILEDDTTDSQRLFSELRSQLPATGRILADTPIVALDADVFRQLDVVFKKLFCALHYKHTGKIVEAGTQIFRLCTTNQILDADDPFEWMRFPHIQNEPIIRRNGRSLTDQFDYKWGYTSHDGVFGIVFHMRNGIYGVMVGPLNTNQVAQFDSEDVIRTNGAQR